jgi:hypothetical protein
MVTIHPQWSYILRMVILLSMVIMLRGHDTQRVYISLIQQHMKYSVLVPVYMYTYYTRAVSLLLVEGWCISYPSTIRWRVSQYYQMESIPSA